MAVRPYFMMFRGKPRMVDAGSPALAVQHVVQDQITELRPARAGEVSAWVRAGNPIESAGEKKVEQSTGDDNTRDEGFDGADARDWLASLDAVSGGDRAHAIAEFDRCAAEDRMTLMAFDEIRAVIPEFAVALATGPWADKQPPTCDDIRAAIEEQPMPFDRVVRQLGRHKHAVLNDDGSVIPATGTLSVTE